MPTRSAAEAIERSANGSIARTLNRKTSLLRIVPTACGQAADIAANMTRRAGDFRRRAARSCRDARRLRIDRDVTSRSILGAILPLHDVRYHACASGFAASWRKRKTFSADEPKLGWWSQTESNRRPPACKAGALPTELWPLQVYRSQHRRRTRAPDHRYLIPESGGPGKI